jgi:hypothetical protein
MATMNREELRRLQAYRGFPALSLRMPTHRKMPEAMQDPTRLKNLVRRAEKALLEKEVSGSVVHDYVHRLERFHRNLDYRHLDRGLCVFVSPDRLESILIPQAVEEAVVVGETFLTRDLVRVVNRMPRYGLLVLSEKATRWFDGWGLRLNEDVGGEFPMANDIDAGEPPEGFNRGVDPKMYANECLRLFLRQVGDTVRARLNSHPAPLFVAGVDRLRAFYLEVGDESKVAGEVEGNFDHSSDHELTEAMEPVLEEWQQAHRQQVLDRFDAVKGTRNGLAGLQPVGKAAAMGRVETLLVEDRYAVPGSFDRVTGEVRCEEGQATELAADDVVDEIVETVMERGGEVVFYREARLAAAGAPIGAILRF